jgi:hypothetical protein
MLREIVEKLDEVLCPEARDFVKKISKMSGVVTLKRQDGEEFEVDSDTGVIGGYVPATNSKGKSVDLDLCGNHSYKFA